MRAAQPGGTQAHCHQVQRTLVVILLCSHLLTDQCFGIVFTASVSNLAYVTKDNLAEALMGPEGKIAGMIVSMVQSGRKRERSPLPDGGGGRMGGY